MRTTTNSLILRRTLLALAALAASLLMVLGTAALPAQAQSAPSGTTITVNTDRDLPRSDGSCALRDAIEAANTNQAVDTCPAGSAEGEDVITFQRGFGTFTVFMQLPTITDGAGLVIVGGAQSQIHVVRYEAASEDRIFRVNSGAKLTLRNVGVFNGDTYHSSSPGGSILNYGKLEVINSTIANNSAGTGGGIDNSGTLTATNFTVANNSAGSGGGGIAGQTATLRSTIVANNTGGNCRGTIVDGGYNIEDANTCGFNEDNNSKYGTDPKLDPQGLRFNGFTSLTRTIALLPDSPAKDIIPKATNDCGTGITQDQRGVKRPQWSNCDAGAFEIEKPNDPPDAQDDSVNTQEDTAQEITVLGNDSDPDPDDILTVAEVSDPDHCTATIEPDKKALEYKPDEHYNGEDSFTYKASDGNLDSNVATVTIVVNPVNDEPVGTTDTKETPENTPLVMTQADLTNNDEAGAANESSQTLTITEVSGPQHGTVTLNKDTSEITFTPDAGYNCKEASFLYTLCDDGQPQECSTNKVTVNVTVTEVNDQPVAQDDEVSVPEDGEQFFDPLSSDSAGPANEADQTLKVDSIASQPTHGAATLITSGADAGKVSYKPNGDYYGSDSLTYKVCDNGTTKGEPDPKCAVGTVSVSVNPTNDSPVANNDSYRLKEDTKLEVPRSSGVLKNDSDVDGDRLSATTLRKPKHGSLTLRANGSFVYRPAKDYTGRDQFTYTLSDGQGGKDTATVILRVASVPEAAPAEDRGCTITGTEGEDILKGTPRADVICGLGGDDVIHGYGDDDVLYGDAGDDKLRGGAGEDKLYGGAGTDITRQD